MAPDQEAKHRDRHAGERDESIAEDRFAREGADQFADHPHSRKHHDVHRGMRVEPEQVLEEDRVAAARRIENAELEHAFHEQQHNGHGQHRGAQDLNQAGGVVGPDEQRHAEPGHARRAHAVYGDDEVQSGEDGGEAGDEDAQRGRDHPAVGVGGGVGRVEGPPGVHAARDHGEERERSARHQQVPAQQVNAGEGQVARADHDRQEEIAKHRGNGRDQEEEDHHDRVHGEQLVIGIARDQVALRRKKLDADQGRERAADEEEQRNRKQIQQPDTLVVFGQKPRFEPVTGV